MQSWADIARAEQVSVQTYVHRPNTVSSPTVEQLSELSSCRDPDLCHPGMDTGKALG